VSGKVRHKILEYLGRNPSSERVARAQEYWGITKPKPAVAAKPPVKMLEVHPLGKLPVAALVARVLSVPLEKCELCARAVQQYNGKCIGYNCGSTVVPDLLTKHADGGRVYCARCFTPEVDDYEAVQRGKADGSIPGWVRGTPKELTMISQWPEDWRNWHTHGLEWLLMSDVITTKLFTEPSPAWANQVLQAFPGRVEVPWAHWVAGYLLAGVGAEILLKGLYLKQGISVRSPNDPEREPLAPLGSPQAGRFNRYKSASFQTLLRIENLALIGDTEAKYRALLIAKRWRDNTAHTAVAATGDAGVHQVMVGVALGSLHAALLKDADEGHARAIQKILTDTKPIHLGPRTGG